MGIDQAGASAEVVAGTGRVAVAIRTGGDVFRTFHQDGSDLGGRERRASLLDQCRSTCELGRGGGSTAESRPAIGFQGFVAVGMHTAPVALVDLIIRFERQHDVGGFGFHSDEAA